MKMNATKQNPIEYNQSAADRTERILREGHPNEIIAEIERLDQENAEFNRIEGIDNLFIHHGQSDSQMLDEMVAEFGLEFPDFDIFNYVDPALNAALDAELAKNALNAIDCDIRQPDFNLNRLARDDSDDESCVPTMPERYKRCDEKQKMAGLADDRELQSMRSELQQQKELISELQKHLNILVQPANRKKEMEVEQVSTVPASAETQSKNPTSGIVVANNLMLLSDYDDQSHVQELESMQEEPLDEEVTLGAGQHQKLEKMPPRKGRTRTVFQEDNSIESGGRSLRRNKQARSNGGKGHARIVKNSSRRDAPKFRKKVQTYTCEECGKRFNRKGNFFAHLRVHTGEKPFKCEVCNASFSEKSNLSTHLRTHTGEKPFKCEVCNATFNVKSNLSKHLMIHTGEKPFECDICRETFRRKDTLSDHMNRHSGRKPYKCKKCKKSFRDNGNFSRHLKFHHA